MFLRSAIISLTCLVTSRNLHNLMILKVLRAPISFFDSNPIGRILTRLTQDIGAFDFLIPANAQKALNNTFRALSIAILM